MWCAPVVLELELSFVGIRRQELQKIYTHQAQRHRRTPPSDPFICWNSSVGPCLEPTSVPLQVFDISLSGRRGARKPRPRGFRPSNRANLLRRRPSVPQESNPRPTIGGLLRSDVGLAPAWAEMSVLPSQSYPSTLWQRLSLPRHSRRRGVGKSSSLPWKSWRPQHPRGGGPLGCYLPTRVQPCAADRPYQLLIIRRRPQYTSIGRATGELWIFW